MAEKDNDALPSWSGYNYQGKVMLLYILVEINALLAKNESLDGYFVEIEKKDDFVIYKDNFPISFNQVKAYLSKNKTSAYTVALKKLVDNKNTFGNMSSACQLFVAKDIIDWTENSNIYVKSVMLFKYNGHIVKVTEVKSKIISEISKIINKLGKSLNSEIAYYELCDFIEQKVAMFHTKGKQSDYQLAFNEFYNCIVDSHLHLNIKTTSQLKEDLYNYITNNISLALNEYCSASCKITNEQCDKPCAAKLSYDALLNINIWEYAKIINPSIIDGWENQNKYIECMPLENLKNKIFSIFAKLKDINNFKNTESYAYLQGDYQELLQMRIIPTLLDFVSGGINPTESVASSLKKIKTNDYVRPFIKGSILTASTSRTTYDTVKNSIVNFPSSRNEENSINNLNNAVKIIDIDDLFEFWRE